MADCFSLQSVKEYVEDLRAIEAYGEMFVSPYEAGNYADAIEQLLAENATLRKERDAAVANLQDCMHYAKPKNNNVCNFCKKDMVESSDKCAGWSDFCECEPEWRGVVKEADGFTTSQTTSDIVVHCNIKENAELIAKILDADSDDETYKCCETCENYFSENAAETCIGEEV